MVCPSFSAQLGVLGIFDKIFYVIVVVVCLSLVLGL